MRVIATVEHEDIVLEDDGDVYYRSKAAIDTDGTGSMHGDPFGQRHTSYKPDLNADVDKYIVVPPALILGVFPIVIGCQAFVRNLINNKVTRAVVGDVGPKKKLGEISRACAIALGINPSPISGGVDDADYDSTKDHLIDYVISPGKAAIVDGKLYVLQAYKADK